MALFSRQAGHWLDASAPNGAGRIRALNELPMEQLRGMLKGYPGDWRRDSDESHGRPAPLRQKENPEGTTRVALLAPRKFRLGSASLFDALAKRRSADAFEAEAIALEELSFLLWAAHGVTPLASGDAEAIYSSFRTAPSAGGCQPLESYVAVQRVEGVAPGLYWYASAPHELVLIRQDESLTRTLQAACYDEPLIGAAGAVFLWSAVPYRTEWKYAYLAHRMIALEAGHVCQNLLLAAEACGLGARPVLAYHQPAVDELLALDGEEEFALYLACAGRRPAREQ